LSESIVTREEVLASLGSVVDPDLHKDIVSLGFVKNLHIDGGRVSFDIELTTPACPVKEKIEGECRAKVAALAGVTEVRVKMTSNVRGPSGQAKGPILTGVKNVVAVASGKGGVGKSTVATNLALALAGSNAAVGLMDADIYGPSIPMMLGVSRTPDITPNRKIIPIERFGLKLISMGFLTNDDSPVIWRGPMVHGIVSQFLGEVTWGDLDYLIIDLPPGTGDAQLTITQTAPLSGAVIVSTPQDVALIDARKGLRMFERVDVPVLGIVENMSFFVCPNCGHQSDIFSTGGAERCAAELGVPFLGRIPIDPVIRASGDAGQPIVAAQPEHPVSKAYVAIAQRLAAELSIRNMSTIALPVIS
jgi:ATP-binding protein involved in chromosome partitioning